MSTLPAGSPAPDSSPVQAPVHPRWWWRASCHAGRLSWHSAKALVWAGLALCVVLMLVWLALITLILPRADEWRGALADQATRAMGVPVQIGQVIGHADGLWPVLTLKNVRLLDERGQPGLQLAEVQARVSLLTLSPMSLWQKQVVLAELRLASPQLLVRRDTAGAWHVAGLTLHDRAASSNGPSPLLDWVMSQRDVRIERGAVVWVDELHAQAPVALSEVDVRLRNGLGLGRRLHTLEVAATPPADFGQRMTLDARFKQPLWLAGQQVVKEGESVRWWQRFGLRTTHAGELDNWSGTLKLNLPHVDVQRLNQHVALPIQVAGGHGKVAVQVDVQQGQWREVALDTLVADVRLQLGTDLPELVLPSLQGRLTLAHESDRTRLNWEGLSFSLDDGAPWPQSTGAVVWRHGPWSGWPTQQVWSLTKGGEAQADRLDMAVLARMADRLPLPETVRASIASLSPQGVVQDLRWRWDGLLDAPAHYRLEAKVQGLGWEGDGPSGRPGLSGANVTLKASEQGGQANVVMDRGWVAFPGVFEDPRIDMDRLRSVLNWRLKPGKGDQPGALEVSLADTTFANADAQGQLQGSWQTGVGAARLPGSIKLQGELNRAKADRVWRYLPEGIPADAREYVRHALREGGADHVTFLAEGPLADFPFKDDRGGRFRVTVPARKVKLDYVPASLGAGSWPPFTSLDGELRFEGQRMLIKGAKAHLSGIGSGGFSLHHVEGSIDDLGSAQPHLRLQGQGQGLLEDMLRYLAASPIGEWSGHVMAQAQASGTGTMQLALDIPLNQAEDTKVQGEIVLTDRDAAQLRLQPGLPMFADVRGKVAFTESKLDIQAQTNLWGQAFQVQGGFQGHGPVQFLAQGHMSAEGLRQARDWPALARLGLHAQGSTPVSVQVSVPASGPTKGQLEVQVQSSLQGLGLQLPAPLGKPQAAAWPLKVQYRFDDPQGHTDAIVVDMGSAVSPSPSVPALHVDLRRDASGPEARVTRGVMSLTQAGLSASSMLPMPAKGIWAQATVGSLDVDAWLAAARQTPANGGVTSAASTEADMRQAESYLPENILLKAGSVAWQGRVLKGGVTAQAAHPGAGTWRVQVDAPDVAGLVEWSNATVANGGTSEAGRLMARLTRLQVPASVAKGITEQDAADLMRSDPASPVPALDVVIDQFEWQGVPLGRMELQAVNRPGGKGVLPEWRLNTFRIANADAQLNATGSWSVLASGARPKAAFHFNLDVLNAGGLLTRLGQAQTLKAGKGKIQGDVSWLGHPLEPDPPSMSGQMDVLLNDGQFLKAEPGVARLLGVLSLQSLPRRLTLDFRDVFQQGFAFDRLDGQVNLQKGVARTRNLRMRGVQAVVLMEGEADLAKENQNLHVYVIPEVNAGSASLAYAAINPVVGLGTFLAQVLLRKQVNGIGAQAFHVSGSWADPHVDKVPFRADAASEAEAAAQQGASPSSAPANAPAASQTAP